MKAAALSEVLQLVVSDSVASLDLRGRKVGRAGITALSHALSSNTALTALDLHDAAIHDDDVLVLSTALLEHGRCQSLDLGANGLGISAARALAPLFLLQPGDAHGNDFDEYGPPVRHVRLAGNAIDAAACSTLLSVGQQGATVALESVSLAFNRLGERGGAALGSAMGSMPVITMLSIHGCAIGPRGACALASTIAASSLVHLDLSDNGIGDTGAQGVAANMPERLEELMLGRNGIGAAGVSALADVLGRRRRVSLRLLSLHANRLRDDAIEPLARCLVRGGCGGVVGWWDGGVGVGGVVVWWGR